MIGRAKAIEARYTAKMFRRIVILGASGSGKSTLARALAEKLGAANLELDAAYWEGNWTPAAPEKMRASIERHIAQPTWTIDGNYSRHRALILSRADTIIWLDYPLSLVFRRVLRRTIRRCWKNEELWNGNRERLWPQLTSRDSILLWTLTSWRKYRREYPPLLREQYQQGRQVLRFRSDRETRAWLEGLR